MIATELPVKPNSPFTRAKLYWLNERAIVLEIVDDPSGQDHAIARQQYLWQLADKLRQHLAFDSTGTSNSTMPIVDLILGNQNLTIVFASEANIPEPALDFIQQQWWQLITSVAINDPPAQQNARIDIPVHYGGNFGPDLAELAQYHNLSEREVVQIHSEAHYTVLFLGFQPGFAYLHGLPAAIATPRRRTPRLQIKAGSVGIGGKQTGVYPHASPGGWQIIGRMADHGKALFEAQRNPPCLLHPAQHLRFIAV
jgi:KipI family sensor histidine kinase inhibitor